MTHNSAPNDMVRSLVLVFALKLVRVASEKRLALQPRSDVDPFVGEGWNTLRRIATPPPSAALSSASPRRVGPWSSYTGRSKTSAGASARISTASVRSIDPSCRTISTDVGAPVASSKHSRDATP